MGREIRRSCGATVEVRHSSGMLPAVEFMLIAASYMRRNRTETLIGNPRPAGATVCAVAHLLISGKVHEILLFG
ncbi:NnrU family protein [Paraburkholderia graminis]|uniref:NnrU family protein n=1 Tax=Paraburkholderia graminis TaxID=60548 RepID=UPI0038B9F664